MNYQISCIQSLQDSSTLKNLRLVFQSIFCPCQYVLFSLCYLKFTIILLHLQQYRKLLLVILDLICQLVVETNQRCSLDIYQSRLYFKSKSNSFNLHYFVFMEKTLVSLCCNGHQAYNFCTQMDCHFPSAICTIDTCSSQNQHHDCMSRVSANVVINKLMSRRINNIQHKDCLLQFYDDIIKLFTVEKEEHQNKIAGKNSSEDEQRIYRIIKDGPSQELLPQLVIKVIQGFQKNQPHEDKISSTQFQSRLKIFRSEVSKIVQEVKMYLQENQSMNQQVKQKDWKFNSLMLPKEVFQISNDGKRIKVIKNDRFASFALVHPTIQEQNSRQRLKIKLIDLKQRIYFGIGHKNTILQNDYKWISSFGGGIYCINNEGTTFSHSNKEQNNLSTKFRCKECDVIVLEVNPSTHQLTIWNQTTNSNIKVVLNYTLEKDNSLHFCILAGYQNDQFKIL